KPFARNTGLIYDQEYGTVTFKKDDEKITFKTPHNMEASNRIGFKDINTDSIPPFIFRSNDDCGKTYYSNSLTLGPKNIGIGYLGIMRVYRTRRIIETIHVDFDELIAMASEQSSLESTLHEMTPTTISSGLMPDSPSSTSFVPPSRTNWDMLFQPLFDELVTPSSIVDHPSPEVIAPIAEVVAPESAAFIGSPSSTTVDQDAPSPSNSQTTPETQSLIIPNDVEDDNHDLDVVHMNNNPFFGLPILEVSSDQS
nr:hypothetical protein [Tanacetum cinerariifolium]